MNPPKEETKMVAPPATGSQMVAKKTAKIKLLKPFYDGKENHEEGAVIEVDEHVAKDLCRITQGHFAFSGERPDVEVVRHNMTRAVRVN